MAVAGCGGGQKKSSTTTATTSAKSTPSPKLTPPKAIATADATTVGGNGPIPFRVSIYDLRRDGPFLVLDFGIRCLLPASPGCDLLDAFTPGYRPTGQTTADVSSLSGIELVDSTGLKDYLPVRDDQGRVYASEPAPGSGTLTDSRVYLAWVRYPAPAAGSSALDVAFPQGGPVFSDVPITTGPAPAPGGNYVAAQPAQFVQPPSSTNTAGLTLPIENMIATSGNATGSDSESPGQAQLTLQSDVLFRFGKSNLTPKAASILRGVAGDIRTRARGGVQVTGYTDSIGSDQVNIPLSQARARSVVNALQPLTPGVNYTSQGKGSADPVAPNTKADGTDNPAGRALNRRVTITFAATAARPKPPTAGSGAAAASSASMTFHGAGGPSVTYGASNAALRRDGNLMLLTMDLKCVAASSGNSCDLQSDLAGVATVPPQSLGVATNGEFSVNQNSISGFSLLDSATGTGYIPVRRADGVPVTTSVAENIAVGATYPVWAYFPAPPATTTALSLLSLGGTARLGPVSVG
jgi:outer membrane protein OmpA-like peptidoglycan-associated protein